MNDYVKCVLENAIYRLRFERKNCTYNIEHDRKAIEDLQVKIEEDVRRLTQIQSQIIEVLSAADNLGITLEIKDPIW